ARSPPRPTNDPSKDCSRYVASSVNNRLAASASRSIQARRYRSSQSAYGFEALVVMAGVFHSINRLGRDLEFPDRATQVRHDPADPRQSRFGTRSWNSGLLANVFASS